MKLFEIKNINIFIANYIFRLNNCINSMVKIDYIDKFKDSVNNYMFNIDHSCKYKLNLNLYKINIKDKFIKELI